MGDAVRAMGADELQAAADAGNLDAQTLLGVRLSFGLGMEPDPAKGLELLTNAAAAGNVTAQGGLGRIYIDGKNVPKDLAKGLALIQAAADQGSAYAELDLAFLYLKGIGVPRSDAKALEWAQRAADRGYRRAFNTLGDHYADGLGVEASPLFAYALYNAAAGSPYDVSEIGKMRRDGIADKLNAKGIQVAQGLSQQMSEGKPSEVIAKYLADKKAEADAAEAKRIAEEKAEAAEEAAERRAAWLLLAAKVFGAAVLIGGLGFVLWRLRGKLSEALAKAAHRAGEMHGGSVGQSASQGPMGKLLSRPPKQLLAGLAIVTIAVVTAGTFAVRSFTKSHGEDSTEPRLAGIKYVPAGTYLCDSPSSVMGQQQMLRNNIGHISFRGCEPIGADIAVNVLRHSEFPGPAVLVGNAGGTGWVDPGDIQER